MFVLWSVKEHIGNNYVKLINKPRILSLFSGAGGLDIGFHQAGFDILGCVEIDTRFCATLRANSGREGFFQRSMRVHCEDVRDFDVDNYHGEQIDCVIGGPPCQTFSAAGRRSGGVIGTSDSRGSLFGRFCEILEVLSPQAFVFENVYGLPGANGGRPWKEIVEAFSRLGYVLRAEVVDAADYGVPQHRERLILVGSKNIAFEFPLPTHGPDSQYGEPLRSAQSAISDLQDPTEPYHDNLGGMYGHLLPLVPPGLNYAFFTAEMGHPEPVFAWRSKFHDLLYKVDPDGPCRTIKAQPGKFTGPFHWKNRHFTTAELKRLQSFPDHYILEGSETVIVEQIGNSVPPRLAYVIACAMKHQFFGLTDVEQFQRRPYGFKSTFRQRQRERTRHFKEKAAAALEATRKPTVMTKPSTSDETYFMSARNLFDVIEHGATAVDKLPFRYKVNVLDYGKELTIRFDSLNRGAFAAAISITGLEKYMARLRTVAIEARLSNYDDIFFLWRSIEKLLIARSRFFTLIDIYGHYANRGDTIRATSSFGLALSDSTWRTMEFFGNSINCGTFISVNEICTRLKITRPALRRVVSELRRVRMDVRTNKTHPIIARNKIICTYPFPLLSKRALVESKVELLQRTQDNSADRELDALCLSDVQSPAGIFDSRA